MSYRSRVYYTGTGSAQNLSVTFPYLDISHVHAFFDSILQEDDTWTWLNSSTITLTAPAGAEVELRRITPYDPMVTFTNASLLNQDDQNMAALQAIYLIEEGVSFSEVGFETTRTYAITYVIEGGGVDIPAGECGDLVIPMACTINAVYALADQSGAVAVDVRKCSFADYPTTAGDSIVASAPITLSAARAKLDATLTGWNKTIGRNNVLSFFVNSCTDIHRLTISILVTMTA
jgi:hypothetical protein